MAPAAGVARILKAVALGVIVLIVVTATGEVATHAQRRGGIAPPARGAGPGGQRGRGTSGTASHIERRTYLFAPTNEQIEYDVFVSTKLDRTKPSPLVIALHGLGVPPNQWLPRITDAAQNAGYIVAAPMGYTVTGWYGANGAGRPVGSTNVGELSEKDVMNVLDLMKKEFNVDEHRIYLMGHSMGGAGALFLGIKHKDIWAAVAASSAAVRTNLHTPVELERAAEMPIVFMHGDADRAVPVELTREWVAKAKALKMTYEYHEIRGAGHGDSLDKGAHFIFEFFDRHTQPQKPQALPNATDAHGGFGLPDQRGGRLILVTSESDRDRALTHDTPTLARPELLKTALCSGGRRAAVQFERRQVGSANDGREDGRNFDTLAGSVYAVVGNTVDTGEPCFLASEPLLAGSTVLSIAAPEGSGACVQPGRFGTLRDRPVVHCWPLARLGPEAQVALLEFERRGKDALASLVVVDGSRTVFADFPAEFQGAGQDLWRVDDGGVLSPEGIKIVCALQRGSWYALGTAWAGAEGQLLSLWISEGSDRFGKVINDYWYQAPRGPIQGGYRFQP
jgi:dienelactone hydrolase